MHLARIEELVRALERSRSFAYLDGRLPATEDELRSLLASARALARLEAKAENLKGDHMRPLDILYVKPGLWKSASGWSVNGVHGEGLADAINAALDAADQR